jgi:hypothetical protein
VEALAQSGYQPSRTLVFSLMLGEARHFHSFNQKSISPTQAADIRKVSDYLHATYDKDGLKLGIELPPPVCGNENRRLDRMLHTLRVLFDRLYMSATALFSKTSHCLQNAFDDGKRWRLSPPIGPLNIFFASICRRTTLTSFRLCH